MKIISLKAENIKRLVAIEINPDSNMVVISGRNGQGKTSVLDSIWWALAGTKNIQASPIRKGQEEARVTLNLGEVVVTRIFKEKEDGSFSTNLTVESTQGARFPSPQKMLDDLFGELTFDPLEFSRLKPKEQFDLLKQFVKDFNFDEFEGLQKRDYDKRTDLNRKAKELTAQAQGIMVGNAPEELVDESALVAELEEAGKHNSQIDLREERRLAAKKELNDLVLKELSMSQELAALQDDIEKLKEKIENAEPLPERLDTEQIKERILAAKNLNEAYKAKQQKELLVKRAKETENEAAQLTLEMKSRDDRKQAAITAAQIPVEGIGFGDGIVLLNGLPFEQASDAERLRASIAIAMAANSKLRVIRVRDGSLLDSDAMHILSEMANDQDYQVWVERVGSDPLSVVIEDGQVRG